MKKVLILAYDFPPYNSIGAQRPYAWFTYFKKYGYEPTVVTRHWSKNIKNGVDYIKKSEEREVRREKLEGGSIWRVPFQPNLRDRFIIHFGLEKFSVIRKLLTLFYFITEFYIPFFDSKYGIFKQARKLLKENQYHMIIATGEPFILFKYASKLSKLHKIPWVADYRDGWSLNYNRSKFERMYYGYIERVVIKKCSIFTTVSKQFQADFSEFLNRDFKVIYNGYFEYEANLPKQNNSVFTISFAGTLYPYQQFEMFAQALDYVPHSIKAEMVLVCVGLDFYENQKKRVQTSMQGKGVKVLYTNRVLHNKAQEYLSSSSLLLLPVSPEIDQLYAKIFDYLYVKRKILVFPDDKGSIREIINKTNGGVICTEPKSIANEIIQTYNEWKTNGEVLCNSTQIDEYSRKCQTKNFCLILKDTMPLLSSK